MRKLIVFLLCFGMLFQTTGIFAAEQESVYLDTTQMTLLETLGVTVRPSDSTPLLRRDLAVLFCQLLNIQDLFGARCAFTDIDGIEAEAYIKTLSGLGYISGYEDDTFRPEQTVSFAEFATVAVRVLGYDKNAQQNGGYPNGYIMYAQNIGLTRNVRIADMEKVTYAEAAVMAYNILNADYKIQVGNAENYANIYTNGGTLLSVEHGIIKEKGIVTATADTSINNADGCGEGKIRLAIEGTEYAFDYNGSTSDLLGRRVQAYIKQERDENILLLVTPIQQERQEFVLDMHDAEILEASRGALEFNIGTKTKKLKLVETASYIYNGVCDIDFEPQQLIQIKNGTITLIDNNDDGVYDLVLIETYINYVVDSINTTESIVYEKYGLEPLNLNPDDIENLSITENGVPIGVEALQEWDVLSVYSSTDGRKITVKVSRNEVLGEINMTETKNEKNYFQINDLIYPDGFTNRETDTYKELQLGAWGKFYIDFAGDVAAADLKSTISKYAFATRLFADEVLQEDITLCLVNNLGKSKNYKLATKVRFNGNSIRSEELMQNSDLFFEERFIQQLITYELNDDELICELNTAQHSQGIDTSCFSLDVPAFAGMYRNGSKTFGSKYMLGPKTPIFGVPAGYRQKKISAEDVMVISSGQLVEQRNYQGLNFYDVTQNKTIGAVVYEMTSQSVTELENQISYIRKISSTINEDDEKIEQIIYVRNGIELTGYTSPEFCGVLQAGQGVRLMTDQKGQIIDAAVVLKNADMPVSQDSVIYGNTGLGSGAELVACVGHVDFIDDTAMTLQESEYTYRFSNSNFLRYFSDDKYKYFQEVQLGDVRPGAKVFVIKQHDVVVDVVILNVV